MQIKPLSNLLGGFTTHHLTLKPVTHGSTFVDQQMLQLLFSKFEECVIPCCMLKYAIKLVERC